MTGAYKKADSEIKKPGKTLEAEVVELEIDDDSIIVEPEVFPPPPPPEPLPILPPEPRPGPYLGPDPIVVALAPEPHDTFPIVQSPPPTCLLYTSPSPRDRQKSRMPSSA